MVSMGSINNVQKASHKIKIGASGGGSFRASVFARSHSEMQEPNT
jgi:hypothetical protein